MWPKNYRLQEESLDLILLILIVKFISPNYENNMYSVQKVDFVFLYLVNGMRLLKAIKVTGWQKIQIHLTLPSCYRENIKRRNFPVMEVQNFKQAPIVGPAGSFPYPVLIAKLMLLVYIQSSCTGDNTFSIMGEVIANVPIHQFQTNELFLK